MSLWVETPNQEESEWTRTYINKDGRNDVQEEKNISQKTIPPSLYFEPDLVN